MDIVLTKPPKSARKAKGDGYLRRAEILEAAERIFVADGYEGATIRKIADAVGVSSTALYMHFRDKDEILNEICLNALRALLEQNSEIAARPIDAPTRLRVLLKAYVKMGLEHPNAYHVAFCMAQRPSESPTQAAVAEIGAQCYERYSGVVREIAETGRLKAPRGVDAVAQAAWAACHGLVALIIARPNVKWADADELTSIVVDGLLDGLVTD